MSSASATVLTFLQMVNPEIPHNEGMVEPIEIVIPRGTLLNAAYFMPVVYRAFFCPPEDALFEDRVQEAPLFCVVPLVITAVISIVLLVYPQPFMQLATMAAAKFTGF